jgi:hypothetical protein
MKFAALAMVLLAAATVAQTASDVQRAAVHDGELPAAERIGYLVQLQSRGELDVPTALAALVAPDAAVAEAAAAIVRHQWRELPAELFAGLAAQPAAARVLLHQLAIAPRPSAATWAERWGQSAGRSLDDRCLALAARGTPLTADDTKLLLETLAAGQVGDGWFAALAVLPPAVADASLGRLHRVLLQTPAAFDAALPWFDRLSPRGVRQLLGLAVLLPPSTGAALLARIHERAPELVLERVRAAAAQAGQFDPLWLPYTGSLLGDPALQQRVLALLAPGGDEAVRLLAFQALVEARVVAAPVLAFVDESGQHGLGRVRPLLDRAIDRLPAARLLDWLHRDATWATVVVQALARRPQLEPDLERFLLTELQQARAVEGHFLQPAAAVLLRTGSPAALAAVWPLVRTSAQAEEFVAALLRRPGPLPAERLLLELAEPLPAVISPEHQRWLDTIDLALVTTGDRRGLERLVQRAPAASPGFLRRCTHHATPLPKPLAQQLLDVVFGPNPPPPATAAEMVAWAATSGEAAVTERLLPLWTAPADDERGLELQDAALRLLVLGPQRPRLLAELRTALLAGPLPERLEPLGFELIGSMPTPLGADDLALLTELLLLQPRTDPQREAELAKRWPDGTSGFPLVAAVAQRLRGTEPARIEAAFGAAAAAAAADARSSAIAPSRLLVALRTLQVEPAVQRALGSALVPLVGTRVQHPALDAVLAALRLPALLAQGEFAAARPLAALARDWLLGRPDQRGNARLFVGERDPGAGVDPWAALSAMPWRCELALAQAAGDANAIAAAAAAVREFAGRDTATLAVLPPSVPESVR